jgi:hypothetical protein
MKTVFAFLLAVLLLSCSNQAKKSGDGTVYLRTLYTAFGGGSLTISWIYLGSDGTIVHNPRHGVDPIDVEAEKKDNEENVGSYQIEGDKMNIVWSNGRKDDWSIEKENGEITIIDGGIVTIPDKFEKGETIKGKFAATALGSSFSRVQSFIFKKDGKFDLVTSTAVSNEYFSDYGENRKGGSYDLDGNTLRLQFEDGRKEIATISHWKQDDGKLHLVINNSSFPQED